MKQAQYPVNDPAENVRIMDLLDRLEAAKKVLDQSEDIEDVINKLNNLEYFLRRFGTLKELTAHMLFIEKKMYILKEYLTVAEAADYLNLSSSLIYKLTSRRELPIYKPNGKTIFIRRDDLNRWIAQNRVLTQDELDEYATSSVLPCVVIPNMGWLLSMVYVTCSGTSTIRVRHLILSMTL